MYNATFSMVIKWTKLKIQRFSWRDPHSKRNKNSFGHLWCGGILYYKMDFGLTWSLKTTISKRLK